MASGEKHQSYGMASKESRSEFYCNLVKGTGMSNLYKCEEVFNFTRARGTSRGRMVRSFWRLTTPNCSIKKHCIDVFSR